MTVAVPSDAAAAEAAVQGAGTCVLNFCAEWAEPCALCNAAFAELAAEHAHLTFVQLDADAFPAARTMLRDGGGCFTWTIR